MKATKYVPNEATKQPAFRLVRLDLGGLNPHTDENGVVSFEMGTYRFPDTVLSGEMEKVADDERLTQSEWDAMDAAVRDTISTWFVMHHLKLRLRP